MVTNSRPDQNCPCYKNSNSADNFCRRHLACRAAVKSGIWLTLKKYNWKIRPLVLCLGIKIKCNSLKKLKNLKLLLIVLKYFLLLRFNSRSIILIHMGQHFDLQLIPTNIALRKQRFNSNRQNEVNMGYFQNNNYSIRFQEEG